MIPQGKELTELERALMALRLECPAPVVDHLKRIMDDEFRASQHLRSEVAFAIYDVTLLGNHRVGHGACALCEVRQKLVKALDWRPDATR